MKTADLISIDAIRRAAEQGSAADVAVAIAVYEAAVAARAQAERCARWTAIHTAPHMIPPWERVLVGGGS